MSALLLSVGLLAAGVARQGLGVLRRERLAEVVHGVALEDWY
jgi:hypothetical protein